MDAARLPLYQPQPGWELVEEFTPEPSYLAIALETVGADHMLPAGIWRKLRHANESAYLYRVR